MTRWRQAGLALAAAVAVAWWLHDGAARESHPPERADSDRDAAVRRRIAIASLRLQPERRPPPRPVPAPRPAPPPVAAESPSRPAAPVAPSALARARGAAQLRAGAFPRLRATYDRIGFAAYRDAMRGLGARFFLFDRAERRPVAEVHPVSGAILADSPVAGLSRWPRDVTRHLPRALERGRETYGPAVTGVILLPTEDFDAALLGGLDQGLRAAGIDPAGAVRFDVAYELRAGRLHLAVLAVALRSGGERALPLVIDLGAGEPSS